MKYLLICATLLLAVSCGLARQQSVSRAPDANRSVVNPPGIAPLVPAYSVAIRAGDLVFVSGMTGIKPGTQEIVDGGVAAQTRQTLENIRDVLRVAGATMADVAECTVFLRNMAGYATMNGVYRDFFPLNPPARATVAVTALPRPAALVEIKCSAQVKATVGRVCNPRYREIPHTGATAQPAHAADRPRWSRAPLGRLVR